MAQKINARVMDRWLKWKRKCEIVESNEKMLAADVESMGEIALESYSCRQLIDSNTQHRRKLARMKVPDGWRSWEDLTADIEALR